MNFYERSNSVGFCNGSSSLASLFKSSTRYLLGNEINVLFMVAMGLGFLGLVLFFQLFKPVFIGGGACYFSFFLFGGGVGLWFSFVVCWGFFKP